MKKILLSIVGILVAGAAIAQTYPYVDVNQISFVSQADLQNCNDSSLYFGDTIITRGIVITDGRFSEVASSSVTGGSRPFLAINDTSNGGVTGPFRGICIMGAFSSGTGTSPVTVIQTLRPGFEIEMTCIVNEFNGLIQLTPLDNSSITIVGAATAPAPVVVPVGDLQDNMRLNQLTTGEQWEGSYVELQNVTVTNVSAFSNRVEFTVEDASGNQILVADRFLAMRVAGIATVNPNSPVAVGSFIPPSVGTVYNYIRGVIFQDENGPCYPGASGFAGGYEINPIDSTDFDQAASPAIISSVQRDILIPNATQTVTITADIIDLDGTVTSATLAYTDDQTAGAALFSSIAMTNTSGSNYTATIPAFPLDSVVRYFIVAIDDSSNITSNPTSSVTGPLNTHFYTVRPNGATIMDIQYNPAGGDSPLEDDSVTVTGIVTASFQTGDLGYLYIQDATADEYAGVFINGGLNVFGLSKGDEVTVRGAVEESFGFTQLNAATVTPTGTIGVTINPVVLDPSDTILFGSNTGTALEKYESMLLRYEDKNLTKKIYVTNPIDSTSTGFVTGDYFVGTGPAATTEARILAGRQVDGEAQGSLNVSYVSDTASFGSGLNVAPIQLNRTYSFDAVEGILFYAFGNFKLTPRNNMDFYNVTVGIQSLTSNEVETAIYPNPAQNQVNIQIDEAYAFNTLNVQVIDLTGRLVMETQLNSAMSTLNMEELKRGMYLVRIANGTETIHASKLILK